VSESDQDAQPLGWRRAELLLAAPLLALCAAGPLDNLAGPPAVFLTVMLVAPAAVPGRRACGLVCVILGSACAVLSALTLLLGLIPVFLPPALVVVLVGAGYLNPREQGPRVLAWLVLIATTTAVLVLEWSAFFPARDYLRVVPQSPGTVTELELAPQLWSAGLDVGIASDCHGNLYVTDIGTSARNRERAIKLTLSFPGVATADWSTGPDC
jgi:hypothetical protein